MEMEDSEFELVIIGGGPAGLIFKTLLRFYLKIHIKKLKRWKIKRI